MIEEYKDEDFCLSLIEVFIRDGARAFEQLRSSLESGDTVVAYAAAHSLKNMLGVLRSTQGVELAELVCTQVSGNAPDPGTPESREFQIHELLGLTASLLEASRALVATSKKA